MALPHRPRWRSLDSHSPPRYTHANQRVSSGVVEGCQVPYMGTGSSMMSHNRRYGDSSTIGVLPISGSSLCTVGTGTSTLSQRPQHRHRQHHRSLRGLTLSDRQPNAKPITRTYTASDSIDRIMGRLYLATSISSPRRFGSSGSGNSGSGVLSTRVVSTSSALTTSSRNRHRAHSLSYNNSSSTGRSYHPHPRRSTYTGNYSSSTDHRHSTPIPRTSTPLGTDTLRDNPGFLDSNEPFKRDCSDISVKSSTSSLSSVGFELDTEFDKAKQSTPVEELLSKRRHLYQTPPMFTAKLRLVRVIFIVVVIVDCVVVFVVVWIATAYSICFA